MKFIYQGLQRDGRLVAGTIEAVSERGAHRDLTRRGVRPTTIAMEAELRPRVAPRWGRKPSRSEYALALTQMNTLLAGGVQLSDAVASISASCTNASMRAALDELNIGLRRGEPLAPTFARCFPDIPGYVHRMLEAGEIAGRLAEAFDNAGAAMEHAARVRTDLRNALIYPGFLCGFGLIAIIFIFTVVVPRFAIMFQGRFDRLPLLTYVVIAAGMWFRAHWLLLLTILVALGGLAGHGISRPQSREAMVSALMRLPVLRGWITEIEIARWAAVLAGLLEQRVALLQSLELARADLRSPDMRTRFAQIERDVRTGAALAAAVEVSAILPPMALAILRVGEHSGNFAGAVRRLAAMYDERVRDRIKVMLSIIEPTAIVLVGGFVGVIAVAIFLGITSINNMPGL